ncbi:MAG: hypothetical protein JSW11_01690 [Candidatus Heimdallarchaeota archaeon]|nr:MAG: hypothetical protein JSW11_01690 [Candidatus Heimdallarchaeota archaeon]
MKDRVRQFFQKRRGKEAREKLFENTNIEDNSVPRLWQWIEEYFRELELGEQADRAKEIDTFTMELFGAHTQTKRWIEDFETVTQVRNLGTIYNLMRECNYSVPCCTEKVLNMRREFFQLHRPTKLGFYCKQGPCPLYESETQYCNHHKSLYMEIFHFLERNLPWKHYEDGEGVLVANDTEWFDA